MGCLAARWTLIESFVDICEYCGMFTALLYRQFSVFIDDVCGCNQNYMSVVYTTECPKIYRKPVLHLLKYRFAVIKQMQYRFAVNFGTLSIMN